MFLSRLVLNLRDRQARRDVAFPYDMHRTLWRAFPDTNPGRILFRVDTDPFGGPPVILVQSDLCPQWPRLGERNSSYALAVPELKEFQPSFTPGQRLRFRLRANPTKKVAALLTSEQQAKSCKREGYTKNGQRLALLRAEEQIAWLLHKGADGGFRIPGEWEQVDNDSKIPKFNVEVIPEGWVRCGKPGHLGGHFYALLFEGRLEVTDPEQLARTVADGIGSAKGFGFGLLSLAPDRYETLRTPKGIADLPR